MNYFTELSIELANQRDYLSQLFRVYIPASVLKWDRDVNKEILNEIKKNNQLASSYMSRLQLGVLGVRPVKKAKFLKAERSAILDGTSEELKEFAAEHLGYTGDKGIDFIAKINGKYVVGELMLISDEGEITNISGNSLPDFNENVKKVLLLDVVDVKYKKAYKQLSSHYKGYEILSVILLREYFYAL